MDRYKATIIWTKGRVEYVIETNRGALAAAETATIRFHEDPDTGRIGEATSITVVREGSS